MYKNENKINKNDLKNKTKNIFCSLSGYSLLRSGQALSVHFSKENNFQGHIVPDIVVLLYFLFITLKYVHQCPIYREYIPEKNKTFDIFLYLVGTHNFLQYFFR